MVQRNNYKHVFTLDFEKKIESKDNKHQLLWCKLKKQLQNEYLYYSGVIHGVIKRRKNSTS